jgi:transposase
MIYYLWNKNEAYHANYKMKFQEKEQELYALFAFEKGMKNSLNRIEATQGKLPMNDHSLLPLC